MPSVQALRGVITITKHEMDINVGESQSLMRFSS
jgi:hypothetical protein